MALVDERRQAFNQALGFLTIGIEDMEDMIFP